MADTDRSKRMFAAVQAGIYIGPVYQLAWQARLNIGESWSRTGDWKEGWKRAMKAGFRIVPVNVTPADK